MPHQGDFLVNTKESLPFSVAAGRAFGFTEALNELKCCSVAPPLKFHIFVLIIKANITLQSKTLRFGVDESFNSFPLKGGEQVSGLQEDILIVAA